MVSLRIALLLLLPGCWVGSEELDAWAAEAPRADATAADALVDMDFALVAADAFTMGCTEGQGSACDGDETDHTVTISEDLYVSRWEVTQYQLWAALGLEPSRGEVCDDCPVESVNWSEAAAFANAISAAEGVAGCYACSGSGSTLECAAASDLPACEGYRLPTEAEWELAARCGQDTRWAGSDLLDEVAWTIETSPGKPVEVGRLGRNACNLYDLSGNVWEWVHDGYGPYDDTAQRDPTGDDSADARVLRGGGYNAAAADARVSARSSAPATLRDPAVGFRLVRTR